MDRGFTETFPGEGVHRENRTNKQNMETTMQRSTLDITLNLMQLEVKYKTNIRLIFWTRFNLH